ncbi:unnamed protein product [Aphanomyces euteiches]
MLSTKSKGKKVLKEKLQVTKEDAAKKTAAATKRKQEQRAREKAEKTELQKTEQELEAEINLLMRKFKYPVVVLNHLPSEIKDAVVANRHRMRTGKELKKRLEELYEVTKILSNWVFAHYPHEGLQPKPTMMETTLLGHDECRSFGQKWLCEKALNMALSSHPLPALLGRVDDNIVSWPHLGEDETGTSLEAFQLHSQFSVMGDFNDVAIWGTYVNSTPQINIEIVDKIQDELVYFTVSYGPLKSKVLNLAGVFRLKHRIVITFTAIAYDERFPMIDGDARTHGFGWTILDEMGEGVTLCRQSQLLYTPVSKHRRLNLEQIGDLVHCQLRPGEPRENIIAKYQNMMETGNAMQRDLLIRPQFPIL